MGVRLGGGGGGGGWRCRRGCRGASCQLVPEAVRRRGSLPLPKDRSRPVSPAPAGSPGREGRRRSPCRRCCPTPPCRGRDGEHKKTHLSLLRWVKGWMFMGKTMCVDRARRWCPCAGKEGDEKNQGGAGVGGGGGGMGGGVRFAPLPAQRKNKRGSWLGELAKNLRSGPGVAGYVGRTRHS